MKFKLLVLLAKKLLGVKLSDEPRADMYLPLWLFAMGLVLCIGALGVIVYSVITLKWLWCGLAALALGLGILAMVCWKNQTVTVISEEEFVYSTFLGNKKTYRFDQIKKLVKHNDSMTLYVGDGKVHIESSALITKRLSAKINEALQNIK